MSSTFMGLELGKRGLFAQQAALNTTGHNIANANTDGYSRQRAEMVSTPAIPYPGMSNDRSPAQMGTGVEVNKLVRLREGFLDTQFRERNKDLGYYTAKSDTYTKIEEILNEPSDTGIANAMDQFWQSWQELAKNSDSAAARAVVRQRGVAVAESFQFAKDSLKQIQADSNNVISVDVNNINSLTKQIADLNDQISRLTPNNYQPNDLYDKRDVLLDQLSKLVNIDTKPSTNGMVDVFVSGQPLIQGKTANAVTYPSNGGGPDQISIDPGQKPVSLQSGELLGRIEAANHIVPNLLDNIKQLQDEFSKQVNAIHSSGYNLDDIANIKNNPTASPDKLDFFTTNANGDWVVNPDIMQSLNKIAAGTTASVGDGTNAQAISDLKNKVFSINNSTSTLGDFYQNIIGQLGVDSQQAQNMQGNTQTLVNQVDSRRQSVSGVSLDEEMTNMIRFQQAYNAAARVVTVMDQVLDKVINGMGAVR
ncbi:flagellar hook-associated protein FlgK [Neobacillus massiliamazoniensis]|uniref:Flagellar hook-associated protein 1 n=1 Tax=Neobacillus massiliamazoniensis TaxID=1499688 RepID=A0A0U1NT62_9BACI|nr:flagellar hook-associated protein FlgK [Neobacillus massiliamazoniensis]CRK80922.1 flagellar hook-associated protein FlgK [Neobacillus massiliamazoniensis]